MPQAHFSTHKNLRRDAMIWHPAGGLFPQKTTFLFGPLEAYLRAFLGRRTHHSREGCLSLRATSWHSATISRCARGEQPLAIASTAFPTACGSPSDSLRTESSSVTQPQSKDASDTPNACAICASSSSEGGRSPRSSLPKCSWEIRSFSAACSCVIFEASRATRIFRPIVL